MIEKSFETPSAPRLNLSVPQGSIDVEAGDGTETHVVLECSDESGLADAVVALRGDEVVVEVEGKRLLGGMINISIGGISFGSREYRLRVTCPHGSELRAATASASVTARGSYAAADVNTASGAVRLGDVDGDVRVKTVSGDVEIGHVGGTTTAQLVSGDLRLADADSSVTARSVSGKVQVQVAEGDVSLTTVSGDVQVAVRPGSRVHVDAGSVSGKLDSELELVDSPVEGEGPVIELRGKTVSGAFRVVRA